MCCQESFWLPGTCLYKLRLKEGQVNLMVYAVYLLTCLSGGFLAGKRIRQRRFFWGLLSGLLYFLVLFAVSWAMNMGSAIDMERSVTVMGICALGGTIGGCSVNDHKRECLLPFMAMESGHSLFSSITRPSPGPYFLISFFSSHPPLPALHSLCQHKDSASQKHEHISQIKHYFLRDFHSMVK